MMPLDSSSVVASTAVEPGAKIAGSNVARTLRSPVAIR